METIGLTGKFVLGFQITGGICWNDVRGIRQLPLPGRGLVRDFQLTLKWMVEEHGLDVLGFLRIVRSDSTLRLKERENRH